jgi:hypothetical protein
MENRRLGWHISRSAMRLSIPTILKATSDFAFSGAATYTMTAQSPRKDIASFGAAETGQSNRGGRREYQPWPI